MPRQPRLDPPGTLHHVMVRGQERRAVSRDDTNRADFLARLTVVADAGALTVYAWAFLPNHAHLVLRTDTRPLARTMRSLLMGYAGAFTRRHPVAALVAALCAATGCHAQALQRGRPRAPAARTQEGVAYLAVEVCGYPASAVADRLGVRPSAVYRAAGTR